MNPQDILKEKKNFAVIGVSQDKNKFAYRILKRLLDHNYHAFGVSPKYDHVDDIPLYPNLKTIPQSLDVVVFVINKKFADSYIEEMKALNISYAWMQPGTYDDDLLSKMKDCDISPILACVLVETDQM